MVFKEIKFKVFLMFLVGRLLYIPTYIGVQVCKYKRENYKNCYMRISIPKKNKIIHFMYIKFCIPNANVLLELYTRKA